MAKTIYKLSNWSAYNQALRQRGSLSVWFCEEAAEAWHYEGPSQWGTDPTYSDFALETCLRLRLVYSLPLRQTQGFVASLFRLMDLDLPVPDYSTLSRRAEDLPVDLAAEQGDKEGPDTPRHIVIDSSGLKVYREGAWKQRQHGKSKRRTWRKIHIGLDPETGQIPDECLTENSKHDASQVEALLAETVERTGTVTHVGGDGAYDKWRSYEAIAAVEAEPVIPPQQNARIKKHGNAKGPPLPRDEAIRYIRRHGRKKWKQRHGYHLRSLVETAIFRAHQRTEARLGCQVLNRMRQLGMPVSYAVAGACNEGRQRQKYTCFASPPVSIQQSLSCISTISLINNSFYFILPNFSRMGKYDQFPNQSNGQQYNTHNYEQNT